MIIPRRFLCCSSLCVCGFIYGVCLCMFLVLLSFVASERLHFVIKAFPGYLHLQWNINNSNRDGSFTMANSNSFLSPY